ncbi:MAG TPA: hypothetical protein VFC65_08075 [Prolixibacteraceae bacterium]|nr:hypothetical protein [Prolixibacteraceae bacterium]
MSQSLLYKSLFEVKILHHYFLNKGEEEWDTMNQEDKDSQEAKFDIREILDITPTSDCTQALNAHNCVFKRTSAGIIVGIKSIADELNAGKFKAFVSLSETQTFRFLVKLKDYNFMNYTALSLQSSRGKMFVLNNSITNASNNFPSLSTIPPVFENGKLYLPGDMLSDNAVNQTKLFTALVKTSNNPTGSDDWLTEEGNADTPLNYVNINDSYPVANGLFTYTMTEKDSYPIAILKDASGFTIKPETEVLQGDFYTLQVDMRKYPEGIYSIHIDSDNPTYHDDVTFYLLQSNDTPFTLIEIKVKSKQAVFDLTNQEDLLSPVFEIRFRNRRTHWRYLGKIFSTPYIPDNPLPLTRYGNIEIMKPPKPEDTKTIMLPNPSVSLIKAEALTDINETKYYSEIHIN